MAERFLEIEISQAVFTTVYLAVDDEDERFKGLFNAEGKPTWKGLSQIKDEIKVAAAVTTDRSDWERDTGETEVHSLKCVQKAEATIYSVWDARAGKILNTLQPNSPPVESES